MKKILVIEDEVKINNLIADYFTHEGFTILSSFDGEEGLALSLSEENLDLIILDVMLPKLNGFSVLEKIREKSNIPVIMVTAMGDNTHVLKGYKLKVDDYITKPFNIEILLAKVNVLLDRINIMSENTSETTHELLELRGIKIDSKKLKAYIDNKEIKLERKQFEILEYLMENKNIVISRENLLDSLWGADYFGNDRVVDAQIKKLRKSLEYKAYLIKTVFGLGYKFNDE